MAAHAGREMFPVFPDPDRSTGIFTLLSYTTATILAAAQAPNDRGGKVCAGGGASPNSLRPCSASHPTCTHVGTVPGYWHAIQSDPVQTAE
eukprot:2170533-Rhodomonas_salina.1